METNETLPSKIKIPGKKTPKSPGTGLTQRQEEILAFIEECVRSWGYPPTVREIGQHMGIGSTNGVVDHLKALKRKGFLMQVPGKSRALMPIRPAHLGSTHMSTHTAYVSIQPISMLGSIPESQAQEATTLLRPLMIDQHIFGSKQAISAVTLTNNSLQQYGFQQNDILFISAQATPDADAFVVQKYQDHLQLVRFHEHQGECLGVVVGMLRSFIAPIHS